MLTKPGWLRRHVVIIAVTLSLTALPAAELALEGVCTTCSIYILDLSSFGAQHGLAKCDPDEKLAVDPTNGVVYLADSPLLVNKVSHSVSHKYGTHTASWYFYKAIQNSGCLTDDMDSASLIYVYDYCYYTWWLAFIHTMGIDHPDAPGEHIVKGWKAILDLPRWKRNDGRDFIFYDPHPGFVDGPVGYQFLQMQCNELKHATHIVVERAQRNTCKTYLEISKLLVTPYVPNFLSMSAPMTVLRRPVVPRADRNTTIFFRGKCEPLFLFNKVFVGKAFRHHLVQDLENADLGVDIHCSDPGSGHPHEDFTVMFSKMEHSVFCLVLPGDAQSTRRLSEVFMAGCIPVFVGPPYNSMPLSESVPYQSVGVFFNITQYHGWLPQDAKWQLNATERAIDPQEARWWVPDAYVGAEAWISVERPADILDHLRFMPEAEVRRKLAVMETERHHFMFQEYATQPPNAVTSLIRTVCRSHNASQRRRRRVQRRATPLQRIS